MNDTLTYAPPGVGATTVFYLAGLVSDWVHGVSANNGLLIRLVNEALVGTAQNTMSFNGFANAAHPTLTVTWQQPMGQQPAVGAYDHKLSDRLDVHVDYGDRNLVINNLDEQLDGPGQALVARRTYNSLAAATGVSGMFGPAWTSNTGTDVSLAITRASVTVSQPGGAQWLFRRNFANPVTAANAYVAPPGANGLLSAPDSTHYTLTFNKSKAVQRFTLPAAGSATGWLSSVADAYGNTVTYAAAGSPLHTTTVGDATAARSVSFSYTGAVVTGMSENLAGGVSGRSWSYTYDGSGRLSTSVNAAGKATRFCYSGSTNLISKLITARGGATGATCATTNGTGVTDITYDAGGHVTSLTYESSASPVITVTFAAQTALTRTVQGVTRFTDPYSQHTDYTYDTFDRVRLVTDPTGNTRSGDFNTNNDVTSSVSANNYTGGGSDPSTTSTYSSEGYFNQTKTTLPGGASESATYTGAQTYLPDTTTDDLSHSATTTYNTQGRVTQSSKGAATTYSRHQGDPTVANCGPGGAAAYPGALCETRDANYASGAPTVHRILYAYDALGELVSITPAAPGGARPTPPAQTIGYDGQSRATSVLNSRGQTTGYKYDSMDRLTEIDMPAGNYTRYVYNEDGDQLSVTNYTAGGTAQDADSFTYDSLNRTATENNSTLGAISLGWDGNSRLVSYTDPGGTVGYGYDAVGSLTSLSEPGGSCTGFTLSPYVPPTAGSGCTLFQLDKSGHRLWTVHPGNIADQRATINTAGQATQISGTGVNDLDNLFNYTYNYTNGATATGHLMARTDISGVAIDVQTSADGGGAGSLTTAAFTTTQPGDVLLAFAGSDGPATPTQTQTVTGAGLSWTLVQRANAQNGDSEIWKATATAPLAAVTVTATQGATGYKQSLTVVAFSGAAGVGASTHASAATGAPAVSLTTTANNSVVYGVGDDWTAATARTLAAGQSMVYEYSDTGTGDDYWVQRTANPLTTSGTVVSVASTAPTTDRWNLAAVEVIPAATPIQSYGYTTEGRLTTATTTVSGTTTGQYTYCYDPNGNLTSAGTALGGTCPGTAPFTYDGANEILTQPYGTHDTYDLDGNETNTDSAATGPAAQRQTAYSNGSQATTVTVGAGPTLGSTYLSNSNTERYTSATSATNTDSTLTSPLGISAITHSAGGPTLYITRDPQGGLISARVGPGPTGTKYYYQTDRLGNVLRVVNATGQATNTYTYTPYGQTTANQTLTQPFGYTSGYRDPATGLLKLGARYYDPTQNRFTQPDPTGQNPGYMYAGDDPINSADPSGLNWIDDTLDAVSTTTGLIGTAFDVAGLPEVGLAFSGVSTLTDFGKAGYDEWGGGDGNATADLGAGIVSAVTLGVGSVAASQESEGVSYAFDAIGNVNDYAASYGAYDD